MPPSPFLHELPDFPELIAVLARESRIHPQFIEKDYWIMHCLFGLAQQGFTFELKGGTSLSKGFGIIQRFSEDIDIRIEPPEHMNVRSGKNHQKSAHIRSRQDFFDWLAGEISIPGIEDVQRDNAFDDEKFRNAGIRLFYPSAVLPMDGLKEGLLLEVGFDTTTPNELVTISSWAFEKASSVEGIRFIDNRACVVPCYKPECTFVEKLQAVSTKYRKQQEGGRFPENFLRHYYDLYCLLGHPDVKNFIGTEAYSQRKDERFRSADNRNIAENEAFLLSNIATRDLYREEYEKTANLYYGDVVPFGELLARIQKNIDKL